MLKFKRMRQHNKDCAAVGEVTDKHWDTAWAYADHVWADSHGRHSDNHPSKNRFMWLRIPCNDTHCNAYLMIRMNDFLKELPKT